MSIGQVPPRSLPSLHESSPELGCDHQSLTLVQIDVAGLHLELVDAQTIVLLGRNLSCLIDQAAPSATPLGCHRLEGGASGQLLGQARLDAWVEAPRLAWLIGPKS